MSSLSVLIPLDGSEFSRSVLPNIIHLFNPEHYQLTLLRVGIMPEGAVGKPPRPLTIDGSRLMGYGSEADVELTRHPVYASQAFDSLKAELADSLARARAFLEDAGFAVTVEVRFGDAAKEIVNYAEQEAVDLVAMATHGRSGLPRMVMGSVAKKVLRNLRIPVMMVRPAANYDEELAKSMTAVAP